MQKLILAVILIISLGLLGCSPEGADMKDKDFTLTAPNIAGYGLVPAEYTMENPNGIGISPQLNWDNAPKGTKSFAIMVFDPDVPVDEEWLGIPPGTFPGDLFVHWIIIDIPAKERLIPKDSGMFVGIQLTNSAGMIGYLGMGPPPAHKAHGYVFVIYALGVDTLALDPSAGYMDFQQAIKGEILGMAEFTAYFGR